MTGKMVRIALVLALAIITAGCWDRKELNELAITSATGFDVQDNQWIISYQVIIPSSISSGMGGAGSSSGHSPVTVYSTKGRTIREAVAHSLLESPRRLYFAHNRVMVVSERAAKKGLSPILDVYFRQPDSRETVNMLVTKGSPKRILEQLMPSSRISGQGIQEIISLQSENGSLLPAVKIYEYGSSIVGDARSALLPEILVSGSPDVTTTEQTNKTSQPSKLRLGQLAIMKEDKLVGWLNHRESLGVAFITNKVNTVNIAFSCEESGDKNSTFELLRSKTKVEPKQGDGGGFTISIAVDAYGTLEETECPLDLHKPEVIAGLEKQLAKEIEGSIRAALLASRRHKSDVLGFASVIHRKFPKQWEAVKDEWDDLFPMVEMETKVSVTIERVGVSNKSFKELESPEGE
ncbi:Ger(x)C family spore germination protein [Paenibacillus soyae]|uniref:Ger(X)C family spore germination protein n=1 Tax=Paenibacillus soyae TaxID=2969249 RepID=A0A9X2SA32_9BACL|nr:Ger(x)C family spore germination protein [Paenibacillus soyae]MCR2805670.1 Ger(x)C family spore germination protein [Paenibacillus soyae]